MTNKDKARAELVAVAQKLRAKYSPPGTAASGRACGKEMGKTIGITTVTYGLDLDEGMRLGQEVAEEVGIY